MAEKHEEKSETTIPASALYGAIKVDPQGNVTVNNKELSKLINDKLGAHPSIQPGASTAVSVSVTISF